MDILAISLSGICTVLLTSHMRDERKRAKSKRT